MFDDLIVNRKNVRLPSAATPDYKPQEQPQLAKEGIVADARSCNRDGFFNYYSNQRIPGERGMDIANTNRSPTSSSSSSSSSCRSVDVLRQLLEEHVRYVQRDPLIMRHLQAYYSILSGHLQDSLDDACAYIKARKTD